MSKINPLPYNADIVYLMTPEKILSKNFVWKGVNASNQFFFFSNNVFYPIKESLH